jgi:UDP-N-acetylmuramate--alanine ligase
MNANVRQNWIRQRVQHIHFIGVGGVGMSGIAEVMTNLGYQVSGSDLREGPATAHLRQAGVQVYIGHAAEHITGSDVVVVSSAIDEQNPEIQAARAQLIPVVRRAEMLADLVTSLLTEGGLDPTFVIGGKLNSAGCNAKLGESDFLVAEADESDASFLYLQPMIAVVTNVDTDHMGTYGNDFEQLRATFLEFLHHLPFYGWAVICLDDANAHDLLPEVSRPVVTYGVGEAADVRALDIRHQGLQTHFTLRQSGHADLPLTLNMPGHHNVLNALAAVTVARLLDVGDDALLRGLGEFQGIGRRFQVRECQLPLGQVTLVDEYAHHPRELEAALQAVRSSWPGRRLVMVFQPHRFSRTQEQFEDFVIVLSKADVLLLCEVYAAGEEPLAGADSRSLIRAIRMRAQVEPVLVDPLAELADILGAQLRPGDVILTAGAGSIGAASAQLPGQLGDNG